MSHEHWACLSAVSPKLEWNRFYLAHWWRPRVSHWKSLKKQPRSGNNVDSCVPLWRYSHLDTLHVQCRGQRQPLTPVLATSLTLVPFDYSTGLNKVLSLQQEAKHPQPVFFFKCILPFKFRNPGLEGKGLQRWWTVLFRQDFGQLCAVLAIINSGGVSGSGSYLKSPLNSMIIICCSSVCLKVKAFATSEAERWIWKKIGHIWFCSRTK